MRLVLLRHGDAHAGLTGTIAGPRGCRGLTELGREQAARLRDDLARSGHLRADHLVASELPRAIETAQIIAPALGVARVPTDCELCELHTGEADGTNWADYPTAFGDFDMETEPDRPFAPGGDSWNSFNSRVRAMMDRYATEYENQTVAAVCHAGVIAASLRVTLGIPSPSGHGRLLPTNTGLTEWYDQPAGGLWTLRYYNDSRHLRDPRPEARSVEPARSPAG